MADEAEDKIVAGEEAPKAVAEDTTTLGTKPVTDEEANKQAADIGAEGPGMPPVGDVKKDSEALTHEAADGFEPSTQEDIAEILEPVAPTVKVDLTKRELPAFHPQIALPHDADEDHERAAIDPEEIG